MKIRVTKAVFLLLWVFPIALFAQEFRITRFDLMNDKLVVSYDLTDTVKDHRYTVNVYSSNDNFLNPLQKVTGDMGLEVAPGLNKKIIWNAKEEIGPEFSGKLSVELRGKLYIPFVRLTGFEDYKVIKRGIPFTITWTGGTRQNVLNFDLYNGDTRVWTQANVGNSGSYEITIPKSVKTGKQYRFKVSDNKNKDDVVYTGEFIVRRRIPLIVKIIPVAVVGGLAYYLFSKPDRAGDEKLLDPLCPGGENCNQ